jgi:hypothetical protein
VSEPAASSDFATTADIVKAWRPLNAEETTRAEYWLEVASRRVRRRWPDVDARIGPGGDLAQRDVRDVVVALVVEVLGGPPVPNARSWQVASGAESRAVTLGTAAPNDPNVWASWMVELFEGRVVAALPSGSFPPPGRFDPLFEWKEGP